MKENVSRSSQMLARNLITFAMWIFNIGTKVEFKLETYFDEQELILGANKINLVNFSSFLKIVGNMVDAFIKLKKFRLQPTSQSTNLDIQNPIIKLIIIVKLFIY